MHVYISTRNSLPLKMRQVKSEPEWHWAMALLILEDEYRSKNKRQGCYINNIVNTLSAITTQQLIKPMLLKIDKPGKSEQQICCFCNQPGNQVTKGQAG